MSPGTSSCKGTSRRLALAHDGGRDVDHGLQFRRGGVRLGFLNEAQRHAQNDHRHHDPAARCNRSVSWRGGKGDDGQNRKQNDQRIAHGVPKSNQPVVAFFPGNFFRPELFNNARRRPAPSNRSGTFPTGATLPRASIRAASASREKGGHWPLCAWAAGGSRCAGAGAGLGFSIQP